MKKEIFISTIVTIISLGIAFAAGFFTNQFINPPELDLPILSQAQNIVKNHAYYDLPPNPNLEYGMIHGMIEAMDDPYASFEEPAQHELSQDSFEGEFGGIGSEITIDTEQRIVLYPFPDSPAQKSGIEDGDILISVDGIEITSAMDIHTVVSMIRGPEGEKVTIIIRRPPQMTEHKYVIKRGVFQLPSVTWRKLVDHPEIGLIDINLIASSTVEEIEKAITELKSEQVTNFILDLRGNGGGVLDSGIEIAELFLDDGDVVIYQQYKGGQPEVSKAIKNGAFSTLPIVVLIDDFSASASEIIAGALQANQRAPLIGIPSYGKNTIQLVFTLDDNSSIHVTSAIWWLDGGSPKMKFKLIPDIEITKENPSPDDYLNLAIDYFLDK